LVDRSRHGRAKSSNCGEDGQDEKGRSNLPFVSFVELTVGSQSFQELEKTILNGQKLQGPQTAAEVHEFLLARRQEQTKRVSIEGNGINGDAPRKTNVHNDGTAVNGSDSGKASDAGKYPLFEAVWRICYEVHSS
jgi:hypothetical protein